MSKTYDFNGFQNPTPQGNEAWFNNQFINSGDFNNHQINQQNGFKIEQEKSTPNVFKDGSNDIECLIANDPLNQNQIDQFNEFINNTATSGSSNSNSSDKSSPSTILNNVPLHNNDIVFLNNEIQRDEKDLSEKELADRRKAQNRAAQRAFRERKEMKLKELEDKLNKSEYDKANLYRQLEELKKQNVVISTENKLLLQNGNTIVPLTTTTTNIPNSSSNNGSFSFPSGDYHQSFQVKKENDDSNNIILPKKGERSLPISQVWEYLMEKNDPDLDLQVIMNEIKGLEICHEHGAAYPVSVIDKIVEQHTLTRR